MKLLEELMCKEGNTMKLDQLAIKRNTSKEFSKAVLKNTMRDLITHVKFGESSTAKFVYVQIGRIWFSFAFDQEKNQYWFARESGTSWRMIVGYQIIEEQEQPLIH